MGKKIIILMVAILTLAFMSGCLTDEKIKKELEETKTKLADLEREKQDLIEQKAKLEKKVAKLEKELDKKDELIEKTKKNNTALKKAYDKLFKEWFNLKSAKLEIIDFKTKEIASLDPKTLECYDSSMLAIFRLNNSGNVDAQNIKIRLILEVGELKYSSQVVEYEKMPPGALIISQGEAKEEIRIRTEVSENLCDKIPEDVTAVHLYISYEDQTGITKGLAYTVDKNGQLVGIQEDYNTFSSIFEE